MKKAMTLVTTALLLAGCGAPYVGEVYYVPHPPKSFGDEPAIAGAPASPAASPAQEPAATPQPDARKVVSLTTSAIVVNLLMQRSQTLNGTVTYSDGTRDGNVEWSSSDQTIVSVNSTTGEVTGVRPGNATIQARAGNDQRRFMNIPVTVRQGIVEDVYATVIAPQDTVAIGDTVQLEARITNSSSQAHFNGRWSSSNQQVAYVNEQGLVTGRRPGKVTITFVSDQKASVTGQVTLTVADPKQPTEQVL